MHWFYLAFLFYGIAQAGSHLLWNLSRALFSKEEDSSQFSRVNILRVGLRGIIAPALGGLVCRFLGPMATLILRSFFASLELDISMFIPIRLKKLPRKIFNKKTRQSLISSL